ncbi:MAG: sigma factor-like helix-turn-helix DNA-binding protein [Candidatus Pacearchaeota archaeon]
MRTKDLGNNSIAFISLINVLQRKDYQLLKMRFIKKMTLAEVADELGVTNQTIKEREDKLIKKIELAFDYVNLKRYESNT